MTSEISLCPFLSLLNSLKCLQFSQDLHGRRVRVNFATDKPRGFGGTNGYGSGAGYGGSYGNAPYGGSGRSSSNYGNAGAYGGGTYSGSGNNAYGGNVGDSRFGNNNAYDSFQTRRAGPAGSDNFCNIGSGNNDFASSEGLDSREDETIWERMVEIKWNQWKKSIGMMRTMVLITWPKRHEATFHFIVL